MGNRAIVVFVEGTIKEPSEISPQIYLHWNGGPDSVLAFLREMERRGYTRMDYASARFVQVVGEFMRGMGEEMRNDGLSLGLFGEPKDLKPETLEQISHGDNGVYLVTIGKGGDTFIVTRPMDADSQVVIDMKKPETIDEYLKKYGSINMTEGYKDQPLKQYQGILEFFVAQEKQLRAYKEEK